MADTSGVNPEVEDGVEDDQFEVMSEEELRRIMRSGGNHIDLIPAVRLNTEAKPVPKRLVPLFYLGTGEDEVEYSVEVPVSPGVGLRYLQILSERGEAAASAWIITRLVGEDAFQALVDYEALTDEQWNQVLARALAISNGPRDRRRRPKASSNGGGGRGRNRRSGR